MGWSDLWRLSFIYATSAIVVLFRDLGQIIGIILTIAVAVVGTLICVAIVRIFTPLRVSVREEQVGLDISEHGESAYPSFNGLDQ